jgi:hypothetical protein
VIFLNNLGSFVYIIKYVLLIKEKQNWMTPVENPEHEFNSSFNIYTDNKKYPKRKGNYVRYPLLCNKVQA